MKHFILLFIILVACNEADTYLHDSAELAIKDKFFSGKVQFQKLTSSLGFKVILKDSTEEVIDQTIFRYAPYQFDTADVDRDGTTDIIIGLIKATEFDPIEKKRLFILRIDNGHLRPLWLGSKVCQELVYFKSNNDGIIQTIEKNANNRYSIGHYYWESFGLTLRNYSHTEITFDDALQRFKYEN